MKLGKEKYLIIIFTACGCLCLLYDWKGFDVRIIIYLELRDQSLNSKPSPKPSQSELKFERLNFESVLRNNITELLIQNVTKDVRKTDVQYPIQEKNLLKTMETVIDIMWRKNVLSEAL